MAPAPITKSLIHLRLHHSAQARLSLPPLRPGPAVAVKFAVSSTACTVTVDRCHGRRPIGPSESSLMRSGAVGNLGLPASPTGTVLTTGTLACRRHSNLRRRRTRKARRAQPAMRLGSPTVTAQSQSQFTAPSPSQASPFKLRVNAMRMQ